MKIGLSIDLAGSRTWHHWLAFELRRLGHDLVVLRRADLTQALPAGLQLALWLDPLWFRLQAAESAFHAVPGSHVAERWLSDGDAIKDIDLVIDMAGLAAPSKTKTIRVAFNGVTSELGAIGALLSQAPVTVVFDGGAHLVEVARPQFERKACLTQSLDSLFSCVVEWLVERIGTAGPGQFKSGRRDPLPCPDRLTLARRPSTVDGARHISKLVGAKVEGYLRSRLTAKNQWVIGTRTAQGGHLVGNKDVKIDYRIVPDDGQRYYADPFLFERGGVTYLFCEEFPYATALGTISVAEMRADGTTGPFRSVLERPYHLSYPFVFEHDGQTWMIPEASAGGSVELYRCEKFPDQWVLDRLLLDGVPGCDATIFEHEKSYWMILTATRWRGATSDKQRLYRAPSPLGPWTEFHQGLVRINAENTRPAGAILKLGDRLLRPAQNCSVRYGGSMALLEINTLSPTDFDEVKVATIEVSPGDKPRGTHTYSRTTNFEAIDAWGPFNGQTSVQLDFKLHRDRVSQQSGENSIIA